MLHGLLAGRVLGLTLVHLTHGFLLLLPTLLFAGPMAIEWGTGCLACGIVAAAALESQLVPKTVHVRSTKIQDRVAMRVAACVGVCLLAIFWFAQVERLVQGSSSLAVNSIGASFLVIGVFLRVAAIRALGTQFTSDIRCDGLIVHDGVYRWLRHPSEIGLLLIAIGSPMLIGAMRTASAAAILLIPISLWRMHRENIALSCRANPEVPS
jgi:protein-S-isoprenylcysteine O-methyltransferase Ste14